jgi:hypothetical protein
MSERRFRPEVFAGAATETVRGGESAPDVEIAASVFAAEVRHLDRPQTRVQATGDTEVEHMDDTTRQNLPDRVQAGETYSDVRVRRRVGSRLIRWKGGGNGR